MGARPRSLEALERAADDEAREPSRLYLRAPGAKREQAHRLFITIAGNGMPYEKALCRPRGRQRPAPSPSSRPPEAGGGRRGRRLLVRPSRGPG